MGFPLFFLFFQRYLYISYGAENKSAVKKVKIKKNPKKKIYNKKRKKKKKKEEKKARNNFAVVL